MDSAGNSEKKWYKWLIAALWVIFLVAIDQVTKRLAEIKLADGYIDVIPGVFRLEYLENRGAAFGIFQNAQWLFILFTAVFLALAVWFYAVLPENRRMKPLRIVLIVLASGAIGNLIDRIYLHYVRDFLYFVLIDFPIFNVADIYVTLSAIALAIMLIFVYRDSDFAFMHHKK